MENVKKRNADSLFVIALLSILLLHIVFAFVIPFGNDERCYATIPFRLLNGDSLVQDEWHLTQFASLFSCLPVCIWTAIKGSTDGMFVFLRLTYLLIHTVIAVVIYTFFKKYGKWAVLASMMFYIQIPYRIIAISYHSMLVVFLLLMTLCLLSICEKKSVKLYIFAGACFGCCCVNNPLLCLVFVLYLLVCAIWSKRTWIKNKIVEVKCTCVNKNDKKLTKKQKREQKKQLVDIFPNMENYTYFFTKEAVLWFSCGIVIIALFAVAFFFITGGTIKSVFDNVENLLGSSEYNLNYDLIFSKLATTIVYFFKASLGMAWILPAIFIALSIDKKKTTAKHRLVYLSISMLWSLLFVIIVLLSGNGHLFAVSLPLCLVSGVCYSLTENKNKSLFYCMYIPCLIATFFHYLAADTHLAAIGIVLVVCNVAGVFFIKDFLNEVCNHSKEKVKRSKKHTRFYQTVIIMVICLQTFFCVSFYAYGQVPIKDAVKPTIGPYSGLYMTEEQYDKYNESISDMNLIKNCSQDNDPILLASYNNWMYLYLERPIATYSTWYRGTLYMDQLVKYYKENPDKIPKYVYIESSDPQKAYTGTVDKLFQYTRQDLSNGVLLTVEDCKF